MYVDKGVLLDFPRNPQSSAVLKMDWDRNLKYQEALGLLGDVIEFPGENVIIKWVACGDKKSLK